MAAANATSGLSKQLMDEWRLGIVVVAIFGCLVILFDFLNLMFRQKANALLVRKIEKGDPNLIRAPESGQVLFNPKEINYRLSQLTFWIKQICGLVGVLLLLAVIGLKLFR